MVTKNIETVFEVRLEPLDERVVNTIPSDIGLVTYIDGLMYIFDRNGNISDNKYVDKMRITSTVISQEFPMHYIHYKINSEGELSLEVGKMEKL
jgi:hypothetical protein